MFEIAKPCSYTFIGSVLVPEAPQVSKKMSSNLLKFQINLIINNIDIIAVI